MGLLKRALVNLGMGVGLLHEVMPGPIQAKEKGKRNLFQAHGITGSVILPVLNMSGRDTVKGEAKEAGKGRSEMVPHDM